MAEAIMSRTALDAMYIWLAAMCWTAVSLRIWVKGRILRTFGADDWLIIMSLFCKTAATGMCLKMSDLGFGKHQDSIPVDNTIAIFKLFLACEVLYIFCTISLKLSIALLLLRLTHLIRWARNLVLATVTFYTLFGLACLVIILCQCVPLSTYWTLSAYPSSPHPGCIPRPIFQALMQINASVSLVTDGIFSILPIYLVSQLKMDKRTKISISIVLGLGLTTAGVNIARFKYITPLASWEDYTYLTVPLALTTLLEGGIGITVASLATLKPLLRLTISKLNTMFSSLDCRNLSRTENTTDHSAVPRPVKYVEDSYALDSTNSIFVKHNFDVEVCEVSTDGSRITESVSTRDVREVHYDGAETGSSDSILWHDITKTYDTRSLELALEIKDGVDESEGVHLPEYLG